MRFCVAAVFGVVAVLPGSLAFAEGLTEGKYLCKSESGFEVKSDFSNIEKNNDYCNVFWDKE